MSWGLAEVDESTISSMDRCIDTQEVTLSTNRSHSNRRRRLGRLHLGVAEANVGVHVLERAVLLYRAFGAFNPPILPLF